MIHKRCKYIFYLIPKVHFTYLYNIGFKVILFCTVIIFPKRIKLNNDLNTEQLL